MWFIDVVSDSRYYSTSISTSVCSVILSRCSSTYLHGNVPCTTQNKNYTGNCPALQLVQRVECNLVGEPRINQCCIRHQYLYFLTCIQPHLLCFSIFNYIQFTKKPSPNIDVYPALKPQKCCI